MAGYSDVLIGLQYGDEGKARIIDKIANEYDIIARFNGGPNAGHTVEAEGKKIVLHQVPSGIFHKNMLLYIGSGCVINLEKLVTEIKEVHTLNIDLEERLVLSDQLSVILPHHIELDKKIGKSIGTTANGIGPAYADRALRSDGRILKNVRLCDILDDNNTVRKAIIESYCDLGIYSPYDLIKIKEKAETILGVANGFKKYITRNPTWLINHIEKGKKVLFEGAQAALLDVEKGTVPYSTSSHTIAAAAYVGGDVPVDYHRKTIGVAKAIMSRVGNGPFVSEFGGRQSEEYCMEEEGKKYTAAYERNKYHLEELLASDDLFTVGIALRMLGNEYGGTTGRPRRIGMLDFVALKQICRANHVKDLYVTKVDCLHDFVRTKLEGVPVVVGYELDGKKVDWIPASAAQYFQVKPVITYSPHIRMDLSMIRKENELPLEAKHFLQKIEEFVGCKIVGAGVGPEREQIISL